MTLVLDASVALAWCFHDERGAGAEAALEALRDQAGLVPSVLWRLEVGNALLAAHRRRRLTARQVEACRDALADLPVRHVRAPLGEVFALARRLGLSTYDAAYVALARARVVPLATLDDTLRTGAERADVEVFGS